MKLKKLSRICGLCAPIFAVAALAGVHSSAQVFPTPPPTLWSTMSSVPVFEATETAHINAAHQAIERLLAAQSPRTAQNTLVNYDRAYDELELAKELGYLAQSVQPDANFRDRATAMVTRVKNEQSAMALNPDVYKALSLIDLSKADAATQYYVKQQLLEFRLSGVDKEAPIRERIKELQDRLTTAESRFERNIADGNRTIEVKDAAELEGLPADFIANHKPDANGVIHLTTRYPDAFPVMTFATSDALRKRMEEAARNRAYPENDAVLREMMTTRYEIARLIGYPTWSELNAQDKMMGSGKAIAQFIAELDKTVRPTEQREFDMELTELRKSNPEATEIQTYQQQRLAELVRRARYDFDSSSVRVYFPYQRVKQGVLDTAARLFHLEFRQELNAAAWDPSVETWDVLEAGKPIGRFYLDMHPRPGKYNHNATYTTVVGVAGKRLPEAVLVCNFPTPTATDPGLMQYQDAVTFFHEFGHLVHHIVAGKQQWAGLSGIAAESDFNEAPSQMLEEWMANPEVLSSFAKHHKTGEPIPAELVLRMNRAAAFGRASYVASQNGLSATSYDLYNVDPSRVDPYALADENHRKYTLLMPSKGGHGIASVPHLAGYSSMYYTYMWDKVIAEDLYAQFNATNPFAGDTPMRYRRDILEPGGSVSANVTLQKFLGRPVQMEAFKRWLGQEFAVAPVIPSSGTSVEAH